MKKVWELDWRDKSIHRHMALAATQLRKVARSIRDYKTSPEWLQHAEEAEGAARIMKTWMEELKKEGKEGGGEMTTKEKPILDVCCGSRMFWFDKDNENTVESELLQTIHRLRKALRAHCDICAYDNGFDARKCTNCTWKERAERILKEQK